MSAGLADVPGALDQQIERSHGLGSISPRADPLTALSAAAHAGAQAKYFRMVTKATAARTDGGAAWQQSSQPRACPGRSVM